jgi:hypothetical protein
MNCSINGLFNFSNLIEPNKYVLQIGILSNKKLIEIANKLDHGTDEVIKIPRRVLAVVPEAKEQGILDWFGIPARPFLEESIKIIFRKLG